MMRLRCEVIAWLLLGACNRAFGLDPTILTDAAPEIDAGPDLGDRDRDGIPDPEDPCIQSIWDREADWDGDSYPNKSDGCPFDYESMDSDGDTIWDECDPFVTMTGDRRRCLMAFRNPTMNRELWDVRDGSPDAFDLLGPITGRMNGRLVAEESFEAPTTTSYELVSYAGNPIAPATEGAVTFWLRTGDAPSATDIGCEVRGDGSSTKLTILGTSPVVSTPISQPLGRLFKISATLIPNAPPGRNNLRCGANYYGGTSLAPTTIAGVVAYPAGHVGLQVQDTRVLFQGLSITERDDQPSF